MSDKYNLFQVDSFAQNRFEGNPAAVFLCDDKPWDDDFMRALAAEMNLSETAFVKHMADNRYHLRWFTPRVEVDLCGHATLAAAHVLWEQGLCESDTLLFETRSGCLRVEKQHERLRMSFPRQPLRERAADTWIVDALDCPIEYVGVYREKYVVRIDGEATLKSLQPDMTKLMQAPAIGLAVTAPPLPGGAYAGYDFLARYFAPRVGVAEDPVTGSAYCMLAPYWSPLLGKSTMRAFQLSARGGEVQLRLVDNAVEIGGYAKTVFRSRLL